jgi:exo-1,4-beta-D-glucosaminidase
MNKRQLVNWFFCSSERLSEHGDKISLHDFSSSKWKPITIPGTVVNGQFENGDIPDPYLACNMADIQGFKREANHQFACIHRPDDSPYRKPFWYRTEFEVKQIDGEHIFIKLDGLSYSANIWLNGKRIIGADYARGTYRVFDIDVTKFVKFDGVNVLALAVEAPEIDDLGLTFIDWSVVPPDDCMGITQPAFLYQTGQVSVKNLFVQSDFNVKKPDVARLTVSMDIENYDDKPVDAILNMSIGSLKFNHKITLKASEKRHIALSPRQCPALLVKKPKLWWPSQYGKPELYKIDLKCMVGKKITDTVSQSFGIRCIESRINKHGALVFTVNGKDILIRGAGWAPDLMFRHSKERDEADIAYMKQGGLNTIRLEGHLGSEYMWELCDREGILIMAGWPCCNHFEHWKDWKPGDLFVAVESLRSQLLKLRKHPCFMVWLYGSDFPPPPDVEAAYLEVINELYPKLPTISSAAAKPTVHKGVTGVKMTGPYAYDPPVFWYKQNLHGAANLFNTETGPGMSIPPYESLLKMLPNNEQFVGSPVWNFHAGLGSFTNTIIDDVVIEKRYGGKISDLRDYAVCAQVAGYEAWRAMYEAHLRNYPLSTGVIAWMQNSSWPSVIWQLYDYYLNPLGGYFGVQKACEPIHPIFSYDDRSIVVSNTSLKDSGNLTLTAKLMDINLNVKFEKSEKVSVNALSSVKGMVIPESSDISLTHFLLLTISKGNREITRNFYWLSTKPDVFPEKGIWYHFPVQEHADMTGLKSLPPADIKAEVQFIDQKNGFVNVEAVVENVSNALAFFLRAYLVNANDGEFITPVFWQENCMSIFPGEKTLFSGRFKAPLNDKPAFKIDGWNCSIL